MSVENVKLILKTGNSEEVPSLESVVGEPCFIKDIGTLMIKKSNGEFAKYISETEINNLLDNKADLTDMHDLSDVVGTANSILEDALNGVDV